MLRKILKNSSYLLLAQSITKVVAFFYTLFLARSLGVSNFGLYVAALAYFSLLSSIIEFGFNGYLIREGAKDRSVLQRIVGMTVFLRIVLAAITYLVFSFLLTSFDTDLARVDLSLLAAIAILPQAISITFDATLTTIEKLKFSAVGILGLSISTAILGFYFISSGFSVYGAIFAMIAGLIIQAIIYMYFVSRNGINIFSDIQFDDLKKIILGSLPYGFLAVLGLLYFKIDTLMLSYLRGSEETGIYGASYRFLEAIVFVPSAISSALFPVFARMNIGDPKNLYALYKKATITLLLLSIPVVCLFIFVLPILITTLLPEYQRSIPVLGILALTIPFMFMISPQALVLFSHQRYIKPLILMSVFNLFMNVLLNFIFIPQYGYFASAWITLFSDICGFTIFYIFIRFTFRKD